MAYAEAVKAKSDLHEGTMVASQPLGARVAVQIPAHQ